MFQFIIDQLQSDNWLRARASNALRAWVARRYDPIVHYRLNGRSIALNLSHDLPWNRRVLPTYSENLRRLAALARNHLGGLLMIDVGANVGDSYALAEADSADAFLLIEGDAHYFDLLTVNTRDDPRVVRVHALLSDRGTAHGAAMVVEGGSARILTEAPGERGGARASEAAYRTLDEVLADHPRFERANLLKVDVEGFDCKVLRGGREFLASANPTILFEHHPRLLEMAGEDDRAIFPELARLGYDLLIWYDNRGHLIGTLPPDDRARIADLLDYARHQDGYYYDICGIHGRHAAVRERFIAGERDHAAGLATVAAVPATAGQSGASTRTVSTP